MFTFEFTARQSRPKFATKSDEFSYLPRFRTAFKTRPALSCIQTLLSATCPRFVTTAKFKIHFARPPLVSHEYRSHLDLKRIRFPLEHSTGGQSCPSSLPLLLVFVICSGTISSFAPHRAPHRDIRQCGRIALHHAHSALDHLPLLFIVALRITSARFEFTRGARCDRHRVILSPHTIVSIP